MEELSRHIQFLNLPELSWLQFKEWVGSLDSKAVSLGFSCERLIALLTEKMDDKSSVVHYQLTQLIHTTPAFVESERSSLSSSLDHLVEHRFTPLILLYQMLRLQMKQPYPFLLTLWQIPSTTADDMKILLDKVWAFTSYSHVHFLREIDDPKFPEYTYQGSVPRLDPYNHPIQVSSSMLIPSIGIELGKLQRRNATGVLFIRYFNSPEREKKDLQTILLELLVKIGQFFHANHHEIMYRYLLFFLFYSAFIDHIPDTSFWTYMLTHKLLMPACVPTIHRYQ